VNKTLALIFVLVVVAFLTALLLFIGWGDNQLLTPQLVSKRLKEGMSMNEVNRALAVDACRAPKSMRCTVSQAGYGAVLFPQHTLVLYFSESGELERWEADWHYRIDETAERGAFQNASR
jgi:hypothetical protein